MSEVGHLMYFKNNNQVEGRRGMLRVKPPCECARREIGDGTVVFKVT